MSRPRAFLQLAKPISVIRAENKAADEAARKLKEETKQEDSKNALQQLLGGYSDSEGEGEEEEEDSHATQEKGKVVEQPVVEPPPPTDEDATLADFLSEINSLPLTTSISTTSPPPPLPPPPTSPPTHVTLLAQLASLASLFPLPNEFEHHRVALSTRAEDLARGALDQPYFTEKVADVERALREAEIRIATTTMWICNWDEGTAAYYFTEKQTGQTSWTLPYPPDSPPYLLYPENNPPPPPPSSDAPLPPAPPPPPPPLSELVENDGTPSLSYRSSVHSYTPAFEHPSLFFRTTDDMDMELASNSSGEENHPEGSDEPVMVDIPLGNGWILSAVPGSVPAANPGMKKRRKKKSKSVRGVNKKMASLVEKWESVQTEGTGSGSAAGSGSGSDSEEHHPTEPHVKLDTWVKMQLKTGKAATNVNLQPLEMDWRERKRRREAGEDV
ncbi:hypothetical protein BC936DRAFT_146438 [Jimgerdemannia flammicorona]|uniref:WW domain-containing protein n=1 Tax=Jimgerdemannia flammicorona TaxID=994334 RepID=A0A433D7M6_9FUNG|nr:hypothetical protein BC936DRAFT_146438 [Jimgerdemannia flammicorona]